MLVCRPYCTCESNSVELKLNLFIIIIIIIHSNKHSCGRVGIHSGYWTIDLSQITFIIDDMSQKEAICTKIIWTICQQKKYLDNLSHFYFGRFVTNHICHNFILDDLSQVQFVLDDMSKKKNSDLG